MNLELFIAKKTHYNKENKKQNTSATVRIAILGYALGLSVMILSVAIIIGFKKEIRNKVIGFGSTIQIANFDRNTSFETEAISFNDSIYSLIKTFPGVTTVSEYATKPGILKTEKDFQGLVLKGVNNNYNWTFFKENLKEGSIPDFSTPKASNQILISRHMANLLNLKCKDSFLCYFVQEENVKARKFQISGIYETGFIDYDKVFILGDIRQIQKLNEWNKDQFSGLEVGIQNLDRIDVITEQLTEELDDDTDRNGNIYYVRSVKELNPDIFSWLEVLDINVIIIICLMLIVAGFTMISGLLIIILERTNMIGILKALGMENKRIRKIFLYVSFFLIGKGMLWGNIIGVGLCLLQSQFHIIGLDAETYYLNAVPIDLNLFSWFLLNVGALAISMLMMIGPSFLITKIEPARSIRFE